MNFRTVAQAGITPAYAGKRNSWNWWVWNVRDHPRVCGEKEKLDKSRLKEVGSPPRMRGKVRTRRALGPSDGITPAYAGKRDGQVEDHGAVRDHPRVCGEKV